MLLTLVRVLIVVTALALAAMAGACIGPSTVALATMQCHGVPVVSDLYGGTGPVLYVCATQPRQYVLPTGKSEWVTDHYISEQLCPITPLP